ncbi:MAG: hypothetical protein WD002_09535, partial [Pseudomonadales bacterium]
MTARILEAAGIATVIIGSAMDIVEHCGVPRYVHNDLPLGNPIGPPGERVTQEQSVLAALHLIDSATEPSVIETEVRWPGGNSWKANYLRVDESNREVLRQMGEENRQRRKAQREAGLTRDQ